MYRILRSENILNKFTRYYSNSYSLGVIGVPFSKGQKDPGVKLGPNFLRENGLIDCLGEIPKCREIKDYGNISYKLEKQDECLDNMTNYDDFISCNQKLSDKVQKILSKHDKFLVLGGDHSIGFGSVAGHLAHDPNITVIWIDAHADLNLNLSSPTGNIHGMPVSMFLQELRKNWENTMIEKIMTNYLPATNMFYIGLRDIDEHESYLLQKLKIKAYGITEIDKRGIPKILEEIMDYTEPDSKFHVSFDIDALDIKDAPSTGTPVPGGLTLREGLLIVENLAETQRITGFDLVEVNPCIGSNCDTILTRKSGVEILKAAFGYNRNGTPKNILE